MPLEQRLIEPLYLCRDNLPRNKDPTLFKRELECMANGTLSNVIRQLSCLAFYADDIFNGILDESKRLNRKTDHLQLRINRLNENVTNLDFQNEEVSFVDVNCNELFKSSFEYDQEVLSRQTMPNSLSKKYFMCDRAPPLEILNRFRDDGKDSIKFYTDPNFFIDQWRDEMLKKTEKEKFSKKMISNQNLNTTKKIEESQKQQTKKKPRKPENTTEKIRRMMSQQGEFFVDANSIPDNQRTGDDYSTYNTIKLIEVSTNSTINDSKRMNMNKFDDQNQSFFNQTNQSGQAYRMNDDFNLQQQQQQSAQKENTNHVRFSERHEIIPNSPINIKNQDQINMMNTNVQNSNLNTMINQNMNQSTSSYIPPPPPMPTLINNKLVNPSINKQKSNPIENKDLIKRPIQSTSLAQEIKQKQQQLKSTPPTRTGIAQQNIDARSTLLASIREGIKLRSVQAVKQKKVEKERSLKNDVASILQRRIAMQLSDSESNNSNNESDDDWVDG